MASDYGGGGGRRCAGRALDPCLARFEPTV